MIKQVLHPKNLERALRKVWHDWKKPERKRKNQSDFIKYRFVFSKSRKRIETEFLQPTDQFLIKRNYVKSFLDLCTTIWGKITAFTILQLMNHTNEKQLNNIKYALL